MVKNKNINLETNIDIITLERDKKTMLYEEDLKLNICNLVNEEPKKGSFF